MMVRIGRPTILLLGLVILLALGYLFVVWRDSAVIDARHAKFEELHRLALTTDSGHVGRILATLGHPTSVTLEQGTTPIQPGARYHPARLRLTYEYRFRAFPWSYPQQALLHVYLDLANGGKVDGIRAGQSFGH